MDGPKNIEELTINFSLEGDLVTKELKKEVLTKGAWATVMYLYQDKNKKTGVYGPPKIRIQRYQKRNGVYQSKNKFNISSALQAEKVVEILQKWLKDPVCPISKDADDSD
ncbi:MAG: hypothetical protein AABZ60_20080 [Planctomycetota bacterium]